MMFGNRSSQDRAREAKETRRRKLARLMSRRSRLEALEDRRLLAGDLFVDGDSGNNIINLSLNPAGTEIVVNVDGASSSTSLAGIDSVVVKGFGGDDTLTIDSSNGLIPASINYDGGDGFDDLVLQGSVSVDTTSYIMGADPRSGTNTITLGLATQTVNYSNIEPVQDNISAPILTVNGTNANNAINYSAGSGGGIFTGPTGLVSVDGFETIEFNNKTNLTINGNAGDDVISLNNETTPTGLTGITVNGNDPTASDTVVVNGTIGSDTITVDTLANDGARITGAQPVIVNVDSAEKLIINGQGGNDDLTVVASAVDEVFLTPGVSEDAGSISIQSDLFGPFQQRVPLSYQNLGAGGSLTIASDNEARNLDLIIRGTDVGERFSVGSDGMVQLFRTPTGFFTTIPILTPGVGELFLEGLDGNDAFNIAGNHPFPQGVRTAGGQPDAGSDVLNFNGQGAAVTVNVASQTITEAGFSPVSYAGVETVSINAFAALTVTGGSSDDTFSVTPAAAGNSGTFDHNGSNGTTFNYLGATTATFNGGSGTDELIILGDASDNAITADATSVVVDGSTVTLGSGLEALGIQTLGGNDWLTVDTSGGPIVLPINYDGGDNSDLLRVTGGNEAVVVDTVTYTVGPQVQQGRLTHDDDADASNGVLLSIDFTNLEPVEDDVIAANLVVNGTNANNAINYTGDEIEVPEVGTFPVGLVSIDGFETIEFSNKTNLTINGNAGDDVISLNNATTPTGLIGITVNGNDPTASDTVIVNGTIGSDTITVDTLANDGARITGAQPVVVNVDSAEQLIINGQGGNDDLTVVASAVDEVFLTPGDSEDAGSLSIQSDIFGPFQRRVPLNYQNLGAGGSLAIASDSASRDLDLIVRGTDVGDRFDVASSGQVQLFRTPTGFFTTIPIRTPGVGELFLEGLDGNDIFSVVGDHPFPQGVRIAGGQPDAGSDVLNFNGRGAAVTVNVDSQTITEAGFSPVSYAGVETVNINAFAELTVTGGSSNDTFNVTPTNAGNNGTFDHNSSPTTTFNYSNATTATFNGGGGVDRLNVLGDSNADVVTVNATTVVVDGSSITLGTSLEALGIQTFDGDDTLTVDETGAPIALPINFDGGDPVDSDVLTVNALANARVTQSAISTSGVVDQLALADISYRNVEAVNVTSATAASVLTVRATNDEDTIAARPTNVANEARVWINDGSVVTANAGAQVANFESVNLLGRFGDDQFSIEPVAGVEFNVDGGDPLASDKLIVNSVVGVTELMVVRPAAQGSGSVEFQGGPSANVNYANIETIDLVGQMDDFDSLGVDGTTNFDLFTYVIGDTPDAGYVEGLMNDRTFTLPRVNFQGMHPEATRSLNIFGAQGAGDTVQVITTDLPEEINYAASNLTVIVRFNRLTTLNVGTLVGGGTTESVGIRSEDGSDVFTITPDPLAAIAAFGGQPDSGSDVLNVVGNGAGEITLDLTDASIFEAGVGLVVYEDIENVNVDANAALTIEGTVGNDTFNITPTGAGNDGSFDHSQTPGTRFGYTDATAAIFNGGLGADELNILGDAAADLVNLNATTVTIDGSTVTFGTSLESLGVRTLGGQDSLTVDTSGGPIALPINYNGGSPIGVLQGTGDTLNLITGGTPFSYAAGPELDAGSLTALPNQPVSFDEVERLQVDNIDFLLPDASEPNDTLATAKVLGSESEITVMRATLHAMQMPADETPGVANDDWYEVTAHQTGKLVINAMFAEDGNAQDGDGGDVNITLFDSANNQIASGIATAFGEQIIVPVVGQQRYFIQVTSADGDQNTYDLEIENFAAPTPDAPLLSPLSDSGMMNNDNVTATNTPTYFVTSDLIDFENMGIPIDAATGLTGADVIVGFTDTATGIRTNINADRIGGNSAFWSATPAAALPDGVYLVQAWTRITDGQAVAVVGRSPLSEPIFLTVDTVAPQVTNPDMLASSDTGMLNDDNVTSISSPAFSGSAEAHAKIRVLANGAIVGQGVAASDGRWEITVEPLADGIYTMSVDAEDLAGNIAVTGELQIEIDSFEPNTPLLDLTTLSDSGHTSFDNITNQTQPLLSATTQDPAHGGSLFAENLKYRIYDRLNDGSAEVLVFDSTVVTATQGTGGFTALSQVFTVDNLTNNPAQASLIGVLADGIHNFKLEVEDRAGNISHDFLLDVQVDTATPPATIDMIDSSDSGTDNQDDITHINAPAFAGVSEVGSAVRVYANGQLVGVGEVQADGNWEVTVEPLTDGGYDMTVQIEDWAGNIGTTEPLTIQIDTLAPQRPSLDLPTANDSGMSDVDNITNAADPVPFTVTLDEGENVADPFDPLTVVIKDGNEIIDTFTSNGGPVTRTLTLAEGTHLLSVETTDDAGNRSHQSEELVVEIDRTAPAIAAVPDLLSVSDSGMFSDDNVTSIQAVALAGEVEPNAKVRVFSGTELVGQGIATSQGAWEITTEPLRDGIHDLTIVLEDSAGNVNDASEALQIEIDTIEPNLPYLDLLDDLGHSDNDNITSDNTPDVSMTSHDENIADHLILFEDNFKFRIFDRYEGSDEFLIYDSAQDAEQDADNFAGDMFTANTLIIETLAAQFVVLNPGGNFAVSAAGELVDGIHNLKLEVEDRAGNISHDFLLDIEIDTVVPTTTIDILSSSDSGMFDDDNVTNIQQIAFQGRGDVMNEITLYAQKVDAAGVTFGDVLIIGTGTVGSDLTDVEAGIDGATDTDGLGMWEITAEPLVDGLYDVYALIEDWGGNSARSETIRLEVDTIEPNTPFLDLNEASDSGRHDDDNITNDNTPTVTLATHDTNVALHQVLFTDYLIFRVYDRFEESDEVLLYDSAADAAVDAVTTAGDMFTSLSVVTETLPLLADGYHDLKLEVEDRAGNISHDFLIDVVIDTVAPPVTIFNAIDVDSGDRVDSSTQNDRITNDTRPGFAGTAEADAIVNLYVDGVRNAIIDAAGNSALTVSDPLDGDDAFPLGQWSTEFIYDLNDDRFFATDGLREALVTAEDLAGNVNTVTDGVGDAGQVLDLFIDTQGPQVTDVFITAFPNFDIFTLKPNNVVQGPTPRVDSLTIDIQDLPDRQAGFLYAALTNDVPVGLVQVSGDHSGIIALTSVTFTSDPLAAGNEATGFITLTFAAPLPDDRYTLTLSDELTDPAGNKLDGESNASEPIGNPFFPSGDGIPGGDFVARFTVDSRPEVATSAQGSVYADINGNFVWDPEGQDNDATNRDFAYKFGELTDAYFVGNFAAAGGGAGSGFDKLGAYGKDSFDGNYFFFLDTNDDGIEDTMGTMAYQVSALPVAGNFFNSPADQAAVAAGQRPSDEVGAYDGQFWYLDTNGNNNIDGPGERIATNMLGLPLVGDFNGDGNDDLAVYNNDTGVFQFDLDRDGNADDSLTFGFSGFGERPVTGDFNLDGVDDLVLYVPHQEGQLPKQAGEFHFLISDQSAGLPSAIFNGFSPAPLGNDLISQFGDDIALPLFGNFDPPTATDGGGFDLKGLLTNQANPLDTNVDGKVSALDALVVINAMARGDLSTGSAPLRVVASLGGYRLDASGDGKITALDALRVINGLAEMDAAGDAEAMVETRSSTLWAAAADHAINDLDDDDELLRLLSQDQELLRGTR